MIIAVTEEKGVISTHFAHVKTLKIYDVFEEGHVLKDTLKHTFENYQAIFDALLERGVDAVITGAIGHGSIEHIMGRGMAVYYGFAHVATDDALRKVYLGRVPKGHLYDLNEGGCQ